MIYVAELIFTTDFRTIPYAPGTVQLTSTIAVGRNRVISFVMAVVISVAVYLFLKCYPPRQGHPRHRPERGSGHGVRDRRAAGST